jgi:HEAT repeats
MTGRRPPTRILLREIRRLARVNEAAEMSALVTAARKRRLFGPLLYSTLVVAAIGLLYLGVLRVAQWTDHEVVRSAVVDPEQQLAAVLAQLGADMWQPRVGAAKALGDLLQQDRSSGDASRFRARAVAALRKALGDGDAPVRAAAASALGSLPQAALAAKMELIAALKDEDSAVRLPAAQAILKIGDDSKGLALRALADLVEDPIPLPERSVSLETMIKAGNDGQAAAVASFVRWLSNVEEPIGGSEIGDATLFELRMLWPALQPLLKSDDPRLRTMAALAAVSVSMPPGALTGIDEVVAPTTSLPKPMSKLPEPYRLGFAIIENAVSDTSLEFDLRELALLALKSAPRPAAMHRCGLELARQLDRPDTASRLAAARLLHMIDPDTLAGINVPEESP